jgi:ribonuclease P protein component
MGFIGTTEVVPFHKASRSVFGYIQIRFRLHPRPPAPSVSAFHPIRLRRNCLLSLQRLTMIPASPSSPAKLPHELAADSSTILAGGGDARLHKHADYQRVYKATRKQFSASMSWFLASRAVSGALSVTSGPRVGLTVGKVLGKAHERNLIKRRLREVVRHAIHELPEDVDLILHPKRMVMTMDFAKLEAEVLRIFRQAAGQIRQGKQAGARAAAHQTRSIP